jgi:hypothetical protein
MDLVERSSSGVITADIPHFVGHGSTSVAEREYRKDQRPVNIAHGTGSPEDCTVVAPSLAVHGH